MKSVVAPASCGERIVLGVLTNSEAIGITTSALGRRAFRVATVEEPFVDDPLEIRAIALELTHPAAPMVQARLSILGERTPVVVLLSAASRLDIKKLFDLVQVTTVSIVHEPRALSASLQSALLRRAQPSDLDLVARALATRLPTEAAMLGLGMYAVGVRNCNVSEASARLGLHQTLRSRLRALFMGRASPILGWACALHLVWQMEVEQRSIFEAARSAGFNTTRHCSDRVLYYTQRTPTVLREQFGFQALVEEFVGVVGGTNFGRTSRKLAVDIQRDPRIRLPAANDMMGRLIRGGSHGNSSLCAEAPHLHGDADDRRRLY